MSEIWAKSGGVKLADHVRDILKAIEYFPYEKLNEKINSSELNTDLKTLLTYEVFFHDFGKVSPYFQIKRMKNETFEPRILDFPDIRHNILSLFFIKKSKVKALCNGQKDLYATFLSAIAFHHWKKDEKEYVLHINDNLLKVCEVLLREENGRCVGEVLAEKLRAHFGNSDINFGANSQLKEKPEDLIEFDRSLAEHIKNGGNLISADIIPPYSLYFLPERLRAKYEKGIDLNLWIFLAGFLMRADHFASLVESKEEKKITLEEIEKEIEVVYVLEKLEKDKKLSDEQLWQKKVLNECKNKNVILIAPTGIGKTEFALAWAEGEKFFYTLPLRAATNQMFERACGYFNSDSKENDDPYIKENVGLLHSDADLYLIDKSNISKDSSLDGETLKILDLARHYSLPVNVCTGDQIFPSALKYPGYEKTYATLGYSRLIIDEVQAYDPKACAVVVKLIEDIVSLGGKFLLMTATLPEFVKQEIKKKIGQVVGREDLVEINIYEGNVYGGKDGAKITEVKVKEDLVRHKIEIVDKDIEDELEEIINIAKKGNRVLVILNTVEKAKRIYEKLCEKVRKKFFVQCLHSRLTLNERKKLEKELEKKFKNPKPENEREPKILVATQVVEASLDIDADYLFTEICPVDSLIQRMGRVMRRVDLMTGKLKGTEKKFSYGEFYKNGEANVLIFKKHKTDKYLESGKWQVYQKELLEWTLNVLKGKSFDKRKK